MLFPNISWSDCSRISERNLKTMRVIGYNENENELYNQRNARGRSLHELLKSKNVEYMSNQKSLPREFMIRINQFTGLI